MGDIIRVRVEIDSGMTPADVTGYVIDVEGFGYLKPTIQEEIVTALNKIRGA